MKSFKDLNITTEIPMTGDKIKISKVLNRLIVLLDYQLSESKFDNSKSNKCLKIQIMYEDEKRIIFSGSSVLIRQIEQVAKCDFPLECTIIQQGEHYEFT